MIRGVANQLRRLIGTRSRRPILTILLAVLAGASLLAQRYGGYQTFSGNVRYDGKFTFVRMSYSWFDRRGPAWAHDYPTGETHFMKILTTISNVTGHTDGTSILAFNDPEMFKFPLLYLCEPGYWQASDDDINSLRNFLLKGGFLVVDDFPSWAWGNFDQQIARVFPQGRWIELTPEHPIFHSFFEINSFDIIPQAYNLGGRPIFRAMFEDNDPTKRMYIIANYQNDISEFWEFSEQGIYPIDSTNEAYKIGVNEFVYGITH